jgi:hypothetical protein
MAQYFFDIIANGQLALDEEGMILPTMDAARREASRSLAHLARDADRSEGFPRFAISVRTSDGPVFESVLEWNLETKH